MLQISASALELALMTVDLVLLIATIVLLTLSFRELRGRHELLRLLSLSVSVLSRREYFSAVLDAMRGAREELVGAITGAPPRTEDEEEAVSKIESLISKAVSSGVRVRYVIPRAVTHIHVGYRYTRAGAEVRYRKGIVVYDLRYLVADGRKIVIGLPKPEGEEEPTRKGYVLESMTLAKLLLESFESHWQAPDSVGYDEYAAQVISEMRKVNPGIADETIAGQLRIPVEEVRRLSSQG